MSHTKNALEVTDPSDWLQSNIPKLAPVESALRCQVCKDFFDTPMITSCSHTFCSLCIRRCLTSDGKCPVCRTSDQELRLRRNWAVQEIVDSFQTARPSLSLLANHDSDGKKSRKTAEKRKVEDTDFEDDILEDSAIASARNTRSQGHKRLVTTPKPASDLSVDSITPPLASSSPRNGGLAACPICDLRMKEEAVFLHLDTHNEANEAQRKDSLRRKRSPSVDIIGESRIKVKPPERLPQINYSLLKDVALRKKLAELGIPNTGSRNLLIHRHAEWVNIVNANADSSRPKNKREMLRELDTWDRSTGRSIANNSSDQGSIGSVMNKQFDGTAWSLNHSSDFQDLISKARKSNVSPQKNPKNAITPSESDADAADLRTRSVPLKSKPSDGLNVPDASSPDLILNTPSPVGSPPIQKGERLKDAPERSALVASRMEAKSE
ncbi:MAG: hypothetical protein Q9212_003870 [Teloschistes hypoglaucus]